MRLAALLSVLASPAWACAPLEPDDWLVEHVIPAEEKREICAALEQMATRPHDPSPPDIETMTELLVLNYQFPLPEGVFSLFGSSFNINELIETGRRSTDLKIASTDPVFVTDFEISAFTQPVCEPTGQRLLCNVVVKFTVTPMGFAMTPAEALFGRGDTTYFELQFGLQRAGDRWRSPDLFFQLTAALTELRRP